MVKHSLGMFQVSPVLDFNRDSGLDIPYNQEQITPKKIPSLEIDSSFNPFNKYKQEIQMLLKIFGRAYFLDLILQYPN